MTYAVIRASNGVAEAKNYSEWNNAYLKAEKITEFNLIGTYSSKAEAVAYAKTQISYRQTDDRHAYGQWCEVLTCRKVKGEWDPSLNGSEVLEYKLTSRGIPGNHLYHLNGPVEVIIMPDGTVNE